MAHSAGAETVEIVGQGRPEAAQLQAGLARVLGAGARVRAQELPAYIEAAAQLGFPAEAVSVPLYRAERLRSGLQLWLRCFRRVATRYLPHYLIWYLRAPQFPGTLQRAGRDT